MKALTCITAFCIWHGLAAGGEAQFAAQPSAEKAGDRVKIAFAVAAPTDVEVAVLGADGKVVRHLAAGVLGAKNPPPEPLKAGLSQSLEWDLRDDFGKPAAVGPFKVRVRTGLGVKFGRTVSDSPYMLNDIRGLAADKDGNVYVVSQNFGYGSYYVQVFAPDGQYLRTVMPFPVSLARESVAEFSYWDEAGKRPVMKNFSDVYASCLPLDWRNSALQLACPSVEAGLVLVNFSQVLRLKADGGTWGQALAFSRLFGPERVWPGKKILNGKDSAGGELSVAAAPDGSTVYASGPHSKAGADGKPVNPDWPAGCVFSMKLEPKAQLEPAFTLDCGPAAVKAVDAKGNLWVHAPAKGELLAVAPDGKVLGRLPAKDVAAVAVSPDGGAVYVLSVTKQAYQRYAKKVEKHSGLPAPKLLATLDLGVQPGGGGQLVLSVRPGGTALWLGGIEQSGMRVGRGDLTCYADKGAELTPAVKIHEKDPEALGNHDCIAVDPRTEDVYINDDYSKVYRYGGLTGKRDSFANGKGKSPHFAATDLAVGPDGYLYVRSGTEYSGPFERWDRNLKPAPFPSGTHVLSKYIYSRFGAGYGEKGIGVGRDGRSYLTFMYDWTKYCTAGFGPDGKALKGKYLEGKVGRQGDAKAKENLSMGYPPELTSAVIGPVPKTNGGVRVDSKGDIYIGVAQVPKGYQPPALYAKDRGWAAMVGSVVRFGPEGGGWIRTDPKTGTVQEPPGQPPEGGKAMEMEAGHFVVGAKQVYTGIAPFSGTYGSGRTSIGKAWCDCRSARFDIDMYDRLYLPNCIDNSVSVLDNAGNLVLKFGGYANYDSQYVPAGAKGPAAPTAYVPLGWPIGAGVSEEHVYVCDQLNRNVVRADRTYAAEETCTVK